VTIIEDGGNLTVSYSLAAAFDGDFRGFFFNTATNPSGMSATGTGVTESKGDPAGVQDLGNGANIQGAVGNVLLPDFGVEIGTQGIGKDDFQSGSFVISDTAGPLTLEDLGSQIGVRITSFGAAGGARNGSLKLLGDIPAAPDAVADADYVELGDSVTLPVLANDTDADLNLDPTSVQVVTAPTKGTAVVNPDGTITYSDTVADIAAPSDESTTDSFVYRVEDTDGNFDEATVTANIIDPLVETQTDQDSTANEQAVSLTVRTEDRTANTTSFVDVDIQVGDLARADVNISFIFDSSGSIADPDYGQQILAIQNTINDLRTQFTGAENDIRVQLVNFSTGARDARFGLFDAALDDISAQPITSKDDGATNYTAALALANDFFDDEDPAPIDEDNFVLFVSDGEPNTANPFEPQADALKTKASVTAVGFGGGINTGTLDALDNTGGSQVVANAAALGDVFAASPLFDAVLADFDLTLVADGGAPVVLADEASDATDNGGGSYSFDLASVDGLSGLLGDSNVFTATAVFDADGDLGTTADQITLTTANNVQGAVPDAFWP
jgi:hypothetical protein